MSEPTMAGRIADFAAGLALGSIPQDIVSATKLRVLDTFGVSLAARSLPTSAMIAGYVADQGGQPQAHAFGLEERVPAALAALNNGVLAHSLDFDDTHLPSVLHPSATVIPSAVAAAEVVGASGEELLVAVTAGLEVCVRLGMGGYDRDLGNSVFFEHGQHATSICGTMGGSVAAGMLLGLDRDGLQHALGIAASTASGILEANRNGGTVKRLHCGWAAHAAITAAEMAKRGFTGPPTALEGRFGFFQAFLKGRLDASAVTDGLGESWQASSIYFKPYPANHFTHSGIDAAIRLREKGLRLEDVERLDLGVPGPVVRTIGEPIESKRRPETGYQAQFSGPYTVTAGLLGGGGLGVDYADFSDDLARSPERRAIMALVHVHEDEECTRLFPEQLPAVLRVRMKDGSTHEERVMENRGGPTRPLSSDEVRGKFLANVHDVMSAERAQRVSDLVDGLEQIDDIGLLMDTVAAG